MSRQGGVGGKEGGGGGGVWKPGRLVETIDAKTMPRQSDICGAELTTPCDVKEDGGFNTGFEKLL